MKSLIVAATAGVLLSGIGFAGSAEAAFFHRNHGGLTASERAAIARDEARVNAIKRTAWANGRVSFWERVKIRAAEAHHNALVYRYRHN